LKRTLASAFTFVDDAAMRANRVVLAAVLAIIAHGCALNPVSGRPEFVIISKQQEREIGESESRNVELHMGLVDHAALEEYVQSVGQRLAQHSPRHDVTYTFHVVDTPEPNAFALPGGYVYVTRGLLVLLNSEDELAGVIGHEIGHVAARHIVQQMSRKAPFAVITGIGAGVTGIVSPILGDLVGGLSGLATGLVFASYSREQERQADRLGQQFAARAGWDPTALSHALHTLERAEALLPAGKQAPSFFDSHPRTPERVENTIAYAAGLTRASTAPITPMRDDFLRRLDGVVVGVNAAEGVIDERRFLHPDLGLTITVPEQWKYHNTRSQLVAVAPQGKALMAMRMIGEGNDPMAGARALAQASRSPIVERTQTLTIGSLPAARTRLAADTDDGRIGIDLTWIALHDRVFQLAGITAFKDVAKFQGAFDAIAESFRPMGQDDRLKIKQTHLRIAAAKADEPLDAIVTRHHSTWKTDMVAIANALTGDERLAPGQLVKLALDEPYASK
jgi:predicted Zn-dependent protease